MRKVLSLFTVLSLLLSFTGCSKKTDTIDNQTTNSTSTTQTETTAESIHPGQITQVYAFDCALPEVEIKVDIYNDPKNGNQIPYHLYFPQNYDPERKYPLLLALHGAGEIGTNNESQMNNFKNLLNCNSDLLSQGFVLFPQSNTWWNLDYSADGDEGGTLGSVLHLMEEMQRTYSINKKRIYVTGLSMGGYATWDLLQNYGHLFAAGIPVCGGGDANNVESLLDIPIKIYHSKDDDTVPFSTSQNMYNAITAAGGKKTEFIELDGIGHEAWHYAYADREALCWLYNQAIMENDSGNYVYTPYFKVCAANGTTIVTEEDFETLYYTISYEGDKEQYTIEMLLTDEGRQKLDAAYDSGTHFTTYWLGQPMYSFSAGQATESNIFPIAGVFDETNVFGFHDTLTLIMDMRRRLVSKNQCFERK